MLDYPTIQIHLAAPEKPAVGAPCNGCGVCCMVAPCPVSRLFLQHRQGACPALIWQEDKHLYRCGMLLAPSGYLRYLPAVFNPLFILLVRRYLALDIGCDSTVELEK